MKTFTANYAAKTINTKGFKKSYPAREETYTQDDAGCWSCSYGAASEAAVIDACKSATNWQVIRAEHFPMAGFHS